MLGNLYYVENCRHCGMKNRVPFNQIDFPICGHCKKPMKVVTWVALLEIQDNAAPTEIRKSYRRLSMNWHPEHHTQDVIYAKDRFTWIYKAYTTLSQNQVKEVCDLDPYLNAEITYTDNEEAIEVFFREMCALSQEIAPNVKSLSRIQQLMMAEGCPPRVAYCCVNFRKSLKLRQTVKRLFISIVMLSLVTIIYTVSFSRVFNGSLFLSWSTTLLGGCNIYN